MSEQPLDDTAAPRSAIRARTVVIGLVIGLPLSAVFLWLAVRGVSFEDVWQALSAANPWLVLLSVPFLLAIILFQGLRWRALIGDGAHVPRRTYVALGWFGLGVGTVVPGRPGDVVRAVWFGRIAHMPVARSLASVGVDRAFDVITLVIILLACLPFVDHPDWLRALAIVGGVIALALLAVLIGAWWAAHRSSRGRQLIDSYSQGNWIKRQVSALVQGMATMDHLWQVAEVVAWSFATWASWTVGAWLIAQSMALGVSIGGALFICGVMGLGAAIPSSPGQIGTFQWLAVVSMAVLGVARADALAFSVLLQLVILIPVIVGTPAAAWWLTRRHHSGTAVAADTGAEPVPD